MPSTDTEPANERSPGEALDAGIIAATEAFRALRPELVEMHRAIARAINPGRTPDAP